MIVSRLTHDDEEAAAFVPTNLTGATEHERQSIHRRVFELVETFHLRASSVCYDTIRYDLYGLTNTYSVADRQDGVGS
jgi:hypothetical protein